MWNELLSEMRRFWTEARAGQPQFFVISGAPGSGRTSFLKQFVESLDTQDAAVLHLRCADPKSAVLGRRGLLSSRLRSLAEGMTLAPDPTEKSSENELLGDDRLLWALDALSSHDALPTTALDGAFIGGLTPDLLSDLKELAQLDVALCQQLASRRPLLLAIDDLDSLDSDSLMILRCLGEWMAQYRPLESQEEKWGAILVVATVCWSTGELLAPQGEPTADWQGVEHRSLPALNAEELSEIITKRLASRGLPGEEYLRQLCELSHGNPGVALTLLELGGDQKPSRFAKRVVDRQLESRPALPVLKTVACGGLLPISGEVAQDLSVLALLGSKFDAPVGQALLDENGEARLQAAVDTGLVSREGERCSFPLYAALRGASAALRDRALICRAALLLRRSVAELEFHKNPDVSETWKENRRHTRDLHRDRTRLVWARRLFLRGGDALSAAEAVIALAERILGEAAGQIAARDGARQDRLERRRLSDGLDWVKGVIEQAAAGQPCGTPELLGLHLRLAVVMARLHQTSGRMAQARDWARLSTALACHCQVADLRFRALDVELELAYAVGDFNDARAILGRVLKLLDSLQDRLPKAFCQATYERLCDLVAEFEWPTLYTQVFSLIFKQMRKMGLALSILKARMHAMVALVRAGEMEASQKVYREAIEEMAQGSDAIDEEAHDQIAFSLCQYTADVFFERVDFCVDSLSGEFFPVDLDETQPETPTLAESMSDACKLFQLIENLCSFGHPTQKMVSCYAMLLSMLCDGRERLGQLYEQIAPSEGHHLPARVKELYNLLETGFFGLEHIDKLTSKTLSMAKGLNLNQLYADTLYEALERELPSLMRDGGLAISKARAAYQQVDDLYGLCTLDLLEMSLVEDRGGDGSAAFERALSNFERNESIFAPEQRAFLHLRFGELLTDNEDYVEEGLGHLERALEMYGDLGDVDHQVEVGQMLRDLYRERGDLARYRLMRDRLKTLEEWGREMDPLGLELQVEHVIDRSRQGHDDDATLKTVERCADLFSRLSDGANRQDECYVELSKICRRRADGAESEGGFDNWISRSLDAVRSTLDLNRRLGNFRRIHEEYHELFDDLIAMGDWSEYVRMRRENCSLAFRCGNLGELFYLFEEHQQAILNSEEGFDSQVREICALYESIERYLAGLGLVAAGQKLRDRFAHFLEEQHEPQLAEWCKLRYDQVFQLQRS